MNAAQYRALDRRTVWHPYTRHSAAESPDMPVIVRGEGCFLFDMDGRRYLDAVSSWWACNLGHGHPRIVEAIVRQSRELQHSILGNLSHPRAAELAGRLAALFPDERRVFFAGDGSSAVEAALKIALQYWWNRDMDTRNKFAALDFAYHGDTLGAVSVGFLPQFHRPFQSVVFPVFQAPSPCCGTCAFHARPEDCLEECFDTMRMIVREHAHELAAVIVEPMCQGAGGMRIQSPRFLSRLAELCREHDVLLIADEIAMGFGRTGRMFAFEHAGILPDIVCVGKGLSAGYLPISAAIVRQELYETFRDMPADHTFYHGHTFCGNPIAAAAAVETLKVYEEDLIVDRAALLGKTMAAELAPLQEVEGVRNVRTLGMIGVVEFDDAQGAGALRAARVRDRLRQEGILVRPLGPVVYLMPPLVIEAPLLTDLVQSLAAAVRAA